jgi:hypothetical protein
MPDLNNLEKSSVAVLYYAKQSLGFRKGPGMSRKTGTPNKITKDMKEIIHLAFERAGGVNYLVAQAHAEPKAFMGLLGRIVPVQVALDLAVHFDLGAAMLENQRNLDRLNTLTIDHEPDTPLELVVLADTVSADK